MVLLYYGITVSILLYYHITRSTIPDAESSLVSDLPESVLLTDKSIGSVCSG